MPRQYSTYSSSYSVGPGPLSTAIKWLIVTNVVVFLAQSVVPGLTFTLGLVPSAVVESFYVWQPATYMFLHAGLFHLVFNMLALWMFGTELERLWGTRAFVRYYFVTGIGAGLLTVAFSLAPFDVARQLQHAIIIGASGAVYGLLLGYALHHPNRPIYFYFFFPVPAKYFVMIIGAIAFYSSLGAGNGVANATHLGGLVVGYLYLKGGNILPRHPRSDLKYWYLRWKFSRARKKFGVYEGGRSDDWNRRVH